MFSERKRKKQQQQPKPNVNFNSSLIEFSSSIFSLAEIARLSFNTIGKRNEIISLGKNCSGALAFVHFRLSQFEYPASYAL